MPPISGALTTTSPETSAVTLPEVAERAKLLSLISAHWSTQALSVASRLHLPALLRDGPRTADALAQASSSHGPSICRLLRALASIGVVTEVSEGMFALTSRGSLLRPDVPGSLAAWSEFCGTRSWDTWSHLMDSVRSGHSRRKQSSGVDGFHHLEDDAQAALLFNRAMVDLTRPVALAIALTIDWSEMRLVVDVGGGHGELIATILSEQPALRGVLFDLPHATDVAGIHLAAAEVDRRCTVITGSFFKEVPGQGDGYLLKSVLHDWDDDQGVQILRTCRRAMAPHARLFVIERIAPQHFCDLPRHRAIAQSDLNMLVGTGGRERTESQYRALLELAQLRVVDVLPVADPYHVLECVPA
jgi:hypothetical protein